MYVCVCVYIYIYIILIKWCTCVTKMNTRCVNKLRLLVCILTRLTAVNAQSLF